jgi:uncharacterized membrane protein YgdD (TMEM256/DUF423 family)
LRFLYCVGGISAALAIVLGAVASHAVDTERAKNLMETSAHYHLIHSLALIMTALVFKKFHASAALFLGGILLFSGSLYAAALSADAIPTSLAPIGGVCFILGWILFSVSAFRLKL